MISTSACVLVFSRTARCTISPEPPSTYLTSMPVFFVKSAKTLSYQPSPLSLLRPSALYTVTTFSPPPLSAEEPAADPEQPVRPAARARLPVTAAVRRRYVLLGMELPYGERESAGNQRG